ncbi:MAG TPA: flagellar motor protein [Methylophilus sp.]|nr:flagellar motor protein [Methylophilus sp.]HQQ32427.1 flagellar motor protein [Methylophilus sp.]
MDWGSVSGILLALIGILLGQAIEGGRIGSILQPAAFFIVFFGTLGAVLLQTKPKSFLQGVTMSKLILHPPVDDREELAKRASYWAAVVRKEGMLALENFITRETDPYVIKGLQLIADATPPEKIREVCAIDMHFYEMEQRNAAKIWDAAGGYAPTIGILGAVLGLIHVMENLSDPELLGSGIAVAFVATIYGVGLANLVFLPIANKLKSHIQHELMRREMLLNAWVSMARGDHPKIIEERLRSYLR